jgi:glycosyltransferase involved in cell wall biosynthesis
LIAPAVDAVGDFRVSSGLGTAAARLVRALADAGTDIRRRHYEQGLTAAERARGSQVHDLPEADGTPSPVALWCLNASEMADVPAATVKPAGVEHVIGMWAWETPEVPRRYADQLAKVDEVWVPSTFAQRAFQRLTTKPVLCVPNIVPLVEPATEDVFHLPVCDDQVVLLFTFDTWAGLARKNVFGLLDAVALARATDLAFAAKARLVLKAKHLSHYPDVREHLLARAASVNALVIEDDLSRSDMDGLLARCDIYVSLHRAEGFGLGMAEAAALGKPVIATGYSGNLDFQDALTTHLVGYRLRRVTQADIALHPEGPFTTSMHWAEPSVSDAARAMSMLVHDPRLRGSCGSAAREIVRTHCSPSAVAAVAGHRLSELLGDIEKGKRDAGR